MWLDARKKEKERKKNQRYRIGFFTYSRIGLCLAVNAADMIK